MSVPSKNTDPEVSFSRPRIHLPRVDFPHPLGPNKPMVSPELRENETSRKISPCPNVL
jgi:hypothetical protein